MMKKSTKLLMTGAATVLGVALATGGAYATTGSLTTVDAPGQVLHVSGVGPASEHAGENGLEHANPNAKGLFGWSAESTHGPKVTDDAKDKATKDKAAKDKAVKDKAVKDKAAKDEVAGEEPAKAVKPVKSSTKNQHSSSVKGDDDDADEKENAADSSGHVEAVAPDDAVEVEHDSENSEDSDEDSDDSDHDSDDSDKSDESDD